MRIHSHSSRAYSSATALQAAYRKPSSWLLATLFVLFNALPANAAEQNPLQIFQWRTDVLLGKTVRSSKEIEKNPKYFNKLFNENIGPIIDFEQMAKGIMGKRYAEASPDQFKQFTNVCETSVIVALGSAMIGDAANFSSLPRKTRRRIIETFEISYGDFSGIVTIQDKSGQNIDNSTVAMTVHILDAVVRLKFPMQRVSDQAWKIINVHFNASTLVDVLGSYYKSLDHAANGDITATTKAWDTANVATLLQVALALNLMPQ